MSGTTRVSEQESAQRKPAGGHPCGACGDDNPKEGQFCANCGHPLFENCPSCAKAVLLSQSFCGGCGGDLIAALDERKAALQRRVSDAVGYAKERDFDRAKTAIGLVTRETDYRFADVVEAAKTAESKILAIAEQESESASDRIRMADEAAKRGDLSRVVELLGDVSPKLLPAESAELLGNARRLIEEFQQAQQGLEAAFEKRDWAAAGVLLDKMMGLQPEDESVARLAQKVGKKLIGKAGKLYDAHKFSAAENVLECVPVVARDEGYDELRVNVERVTWLSSQFEGEPLATPTLGRLARRWVECSAKADDACETLAKIAKRLKETKPPPRERFPSLHEGVSSWFGGDIRLAAHPTCVRWRDAETMRRSPARFNVAIGLALQGLGRSRYTGDFSPEKGGLLTRLSKKKVVRSWGLDLGTSAIKAVLVEQADEGGFRVIEQGVFPYASVLTRSLTESQSEQILRGAIESFCEGRDLEEASVWVSFPARELVTRFVNLPPVADKQARKLFDTEIESQIPLPLEDIVYVDHIVPRPEEERAVYGRPAFVSAAKQQFVDRYLGMLESAGLTISGLQATPIALANFLASEFAETLGTEPSAEDLAVGRLPSIALVECGAETTTLVILNAVSCWFGSFESGGDGYTRAISRATKTTHAEAEKLKRDPASLEEPENQWQGVEQKMDEMQGRLKKLVADILQHHREFDIRETWCSGGGALTHGWIKQVLCRN